MTEQNVIKVDAPVDEVIVLEDRAQVIRRVELDLPEGDVEIQVTGLTPLVPNRTLRCRTRAEEGEPPKVLDLQIDREFVIRSARPDRERELTEKIEVLVEGYLERNDEALATLHEQSLASEASSAMAGRVGEELFCGRLAELEFEGLRQLFARWGDLQNELLSRRWEQEDCVEQLDRLNAERAAASQPLSDYRATLRCQLNCPSAGRYHLEWQYLVPCAIWRPTYRAELTEGETPSLGWCSSGMVWQATGEDWKGIKLSLSTARPSLGAEIPLLTSDKLRSRPKTDKEHHTIEVASRDEEIAETGPAPVRLSETPPGLDDGGEARTFTAEGRIDLPGDGRPHRVEIERWSTTPKLDQLCYPEQATFVFLKSTQQSASALPLLAGPVELVRGGGFVGRSEIKYVAPKASFQLSWGSEDGIVVLRELDHKLHKTKIRKRREHDFTVEVYLANHTGEAQELELIERVPVSEIEQVKVQIDEETSPDHEVDDQGLVHWQVQMAPDEELTRHLVFKVITPSNVKWTP
ncbi:MAG: mucoidy inhibitor MuiA family protein [Deltaproteobacteria bacterium]|nr:mucoidy inhibitor MuiA family protein [Deltaproteobacteria bacterium]